MDAAFTSIAFSEPATAETNLALLERHLPGQLWSALPALLGQLPDPDGSLNYLERYLHDAPPRVVSYLEKNPAALHYLLLLFSYSHFLSESLLQQPELIQWLHHRGPGEGLDRIKSPENLLEEFARFTATHFDAAPAVILARFKRREYLRITLRDVLGLATLAETTLELSNLGDVLIERALRTCDQKLTNLYGTPQTADSSGRTHNVALTVLSLGKLGGQELNYSSDIDLMFVYGRDGQTAGGSAGAISNAEYFVRLAQAVLRLITEITPEGTVFRVDMRLRPEGQQGDLTLGLPAALDYYRHRAREWELQMLIRARVSAGDADTGRQFLRAVQPLIYRREFNLAAVEAVLNAREEFTRELRRGPGATGEHAVAWNVKLSPGGIRDIEFLSQCLQRLYGGTEAWLVARGAGSTLVSLQRLHDKGFLSGRDFFRLGTAYEFLRKIEHRLQLRDGLQRHTLPESPDALGRLARRCGVEPAGGRTAAEQLLHRIRQHFAEVREIYERVLRIQVRDGGSSIGPQTAEESELGAGPLLRRLRSEYPAVAEALASAPSALDPYGRRGLQQFLSSAVLDGALMTELQQRPDWIGRAGEVFARSDLVVEMLCRHPEEILDVIDPECFSRAQSGATGTLPFQQAMAALRVKQRRKLLAAVVRALVGGVQPFDTFAELTRIADEALAGAMQLAFAEFAAAGSGARRALAAEIETAPFAVIALGRLGTGEMDVASDADVIFVLEESVGAEEKDEWRRLAERFVNVTSSHTREGLLFPVDTRLRPRGKEGEIVQSVAYLRDYYRTEAEGWEAATILKARPLAGNCSLAARTIGEVHSILAERFGKDVPVGGRRGPKGLAEQLCHTRERLERETCNVLGRGRFKKASGGYYDIEYILSFLMLTRGPLPEPTEGPRHVLRQIAALESGGALDSARAQTLRAAALLYRGLDHAVRLVTGRAAQELPEPALAERVLRLLAEWRVMPGDSLEASVEAMRRNVRALYDEILLPEARRA